MQTELLFAIWRGTHSRYKFLIWKYFWFHITDTDTEKYYFRIISAMNSDKRYTPPPLEECLLARIGLDVSNRRSRFAAIRIAIGSQRIFGRR